MKLDEEIAKQLMQELNDGSIEMRPPEGTNEHLRSNQIDELEQHLLQTFERNRV